jgi:hypothetical protein
MGAELVAFGTKRRQFNTSVLIVILRNTFALICRLYIHAIFHRPFMQRPEFQDTVLAASRLLEQVAKDISTLNVTRVCSEYF